MNKISINELPINKILVAVLALFFAILSYVGINSLITNSNQISVLQKNISTLQATLKKDIDASKENALNATVSLNNSKKFEQLQTSITNNSKKFEQLQKNIRDNFKKFEQLQTSITNNSKKFEQLQEITANNTTHTKINKGSKKNVTNSQKIGYINIDLLLTQSHQFQLSQKNIEKEFKNKDLQLQKKAKKIEKLLADFQKNKDELSKKEKESKITAIKKLDKNLKQLAAKTKQQFELRNTEELQKIQNKINNIIKQVATKEKFDIILYKDIAFVSKSIDITNKITKILNK